MRTRIIISMKPEYGDESQTGHFTFLLNDLFNIEEIIKGMSIKSDQYWVLVWICEERTMKEKARTEDYGFEDLENQNRNI